MGYYPGATAVGIKVKEGVILAADKRVMYGFSLMSKAGKKVFRITDKIGFASAGFIADMQTIARSMEVEIKLYELDTGNPIRVANAAKLLSVIMYNRRLFPYLAEVVIGGVDDMGSHIFVLDPIGALIEDDYTALGTGAQLAISIIENEYSENLDIEAARSLAIKSIKTAISRDAASGDGIDVLTITGTKVNEEFIPIKI